MRLFQRTYYGLKPFVARSVRMAARRRFARRTRQRYQRAWPINQSAGQRPADWAGWPEGKSFAFVLTHDIESSVGLPRCLDLARMEQDLGFRSSFNFVPEGDYRVPSELRSELAGRGFEIGVHGLKHDGKLYNSRAIFAERARRINDYLREWQAVGFRSPFMHHQLEWLLDLNIQYDSSTFDTDPFEPQPDSADTIFPFWVPGRGDQGYVEMPYTLPQDFTVFVLLQEPNIDVWKRKLDWIAARGGMALLDTHPDYMSFGSASSGAVEFPAAYYREFLEYARSKYEGQYWHALPKDVATYFRSTRTADSGNNGKQASGRTYSFGRRVWIDLDNTPHVPFFEPIIESLRSKGYPVTLTARDAFQVCELADQKRLSYLQIGRHHGKNPILKVLGLFYRAAQLWPTITSERPALAISHGSRSQTILSNLLGIPSVVLADYEHARLLPFMRPTWEIVPEVIPDAGLYCAKDHVKKYPGIKEDVYTSRLQPDGQLLKELEINPDDIVATVRPPATEAHYHNPEAETLFTRFMERAYHTEGVRVVLLPRNRKQGDQIKAASPHWFEGRHAVIPKTAVDGLNLLWHSDFVVSGGGTMNREAAALGVPVYSIFRGTIGAVDRYLQKTGRLVMVENIDDVDRKILLKRRKRKPLTEADAPAALATIVAHLEAILEAHCGANGNHVAK